MNMENINNSISLESFPFKKSHKIIDLISIDEPILSLYHENENFYLNYKVDDKNEIDTFLFFKVNNKNLYQLLTGRLSIYHTIIFSNDFVFIYDEDYFGKIKKTVLVQADNLNNEYLPNKDSFFEFKYSEVKILSELFKEYEISTITEKLREKALYLKFESKKPKDRETIPFNDLISALPKIQVSFNNYLNALFEERFKETYTDLKKFKEVYSKIKDLLQLNVVDLKFGSFEVGLNYNEFMLYDPTLNKEIINWSKNIPQKFDNEVLNYDSKNYELNQLIDEQFTNQQKEDIFKPIIEIVNNKNLEFSVRKSDVKRFNTIKKYKYERINEVIISNKKKKVLEAETDKELEMIQVTAFIEKGKAPSSIKIEDNLFTHINETIYTITQENFDKKGYDYRLENNLIVKIKTENGNIEFSTEFKGQSLNYVIHENNLQKAIDKLTERLFNFIINHENNIN